MPARFYIGGQFENVQENEAFHRLCSAVADYMADEDVRVVGNVVDHKMPIDALVFRRRSITVVDFKDYGGEIRAAEDAPWITAEGIEVKGGSWANPYMQVRRYKLALADWLNRWGLLPPTSDAGHISGLVMFTQPARVDTTAFGPAAKKWFGAANFEEGLTFLRNRTSSKLDLTTKHLDAIVDALGARPHGLRESEVFVPASQVVRARQDGFSHAMQGLEDDERQKWWAEHGEQMQRDQEELDAVEAAKAEAEAELKAMKAAELREQEAWWAEHGEQMQRDQEELDAVEAAKAEAEAELKAMKAAELREQEAWWAEHGEQMQRDQEELDAAESAKAEAAAELKAMKAAELREQEAWSVPPAVSETPS